jgi:hypothetical protein
MDDATMLLLGWAAGTVSTFVGLTTYAKVIAPARSSGWKPLKLGRLESTTEQVAVISRDVPPARPVGGYKQTYPSATIYNATAPSVNTQEAYRFTLANDNGTTHVVLLPARYISRFIQMDVLRRDNWTGKATIYTDCLRVAQSRGWIEPSDTKQNSFQWVREMASLGRRVNRLREESIALPSPGRA